MRTTPNRFGGPRKTKGSRIITPCSPEFGCAALCMNARGEQTTAWLSANDPVALPFSLPYACVVTHLGWRNGSAAGSNHDVGIYTEGWARLISTGATAGSGNSVWQFVNVTDTAIPPGRYYLVKSIDATTANRSARYSTAISVALMRMLGMKDSATNASPLPDPLTDMGDVAVCTYIPVMGFTVRAPL